MKFILTFTFTFIFFVITNAQSKIAIVNGTNGSLKSTSTLDSALKIAVDGDYIYLPGGIFPANTINKRVFIFGAGHHPDSTAATGKTVLTGSTHITNAASGGLLEGCVIVGAIYFGTSDIDQAVQNFVIKRCSLQNSSLLLSPYTGNANLSSNNFFIENIIYNISGYSLTNNVFKKNIIEYQVIYSSKSLFENNIFSSRIGGYPVTYSSNCTFRNNVFLSNSEVDYGGTLNSFNNNLSIVSIPDNQFSMGNLKTTIDSIFINYSRFYTNLYIQNFHLKPNSPGKNLGTDGTDVGIYGTNAPTKAGWVPSNPHISFKSVGQQTDANGNLKATFKVRAQNN